jgi:glycosyltransferase involved in cell wall biosynthesis
MSGEATTLSSSRPVSRAVRAAARGIAPVSVTLDGRALGPTRAGTQVHALELAAALVRTERIALRVVVPPDLDDQARAALSGAELLSYRDAAGGHAAPTDVVHRPNQVFSADDLALLLPLGERLVVTHQDLIAYRIPSYHATQEDWERYRAVTRHTLGSADRVLFFSEHALRDATADDLLDPADAAVVPIGTDHAALPRARPAPPTGFDPDGGAYMLCLGTDLRHKNRLFALALLRALQARGWEGRLVLAGAHAAYGSSRDDEDRILSPEPGLAGAVTRLGQIDEPERAWLMEHTTAVLYPSLYEGFGLLPFEAARAGVPSLFASQTSLAEFLPTTLAVLRPWDAGASADAALPLLTDPEARKAHVNAVRAVARELTWDRTAQQLLSEYELVVAQPAREATAGSRERLELAQRLHESEQARYAELAQFEAFKAQIGADALSLAGPDGFLDAGDQRALLALVSRGPLKRALFAPLRSAYRLAHKRAR